MPAKLAASAFTLFSRHGIRNVSLDQIAAHAKVTKGSLYWHFASKDELIHAAGKHYYAAYHRRINTALAHVTDPVARLSRTLDVAVRICLLDHANRVFTTEIFTLALTDPRLRRSWRKFSDEVRDHYVRLLEAAGATGKLRVVNPDQSVDYMLSTMEGIKLRALYEPHLCSPRRAQEIGRMLKQMLGFPT
jgi:AcrR family transcriptional regulator